MERSFRTIIVILPLLLLAACAKPQIFSTPGKRQVPLPSKWAPPGSVVPATQHPYIIKGKTYYPIPSSHGYEETGVASWYGPNFHGRKTANGETYDMHGMTAAHKTLPINTQLLVKNLSNNREVVVRINDRGPFVNDRVIDLSLTAAKKLDIVEKGTATVQLTAMGEAISYHEGQRRVERFLPHKNFNSGEFYVQIGSFANHDNARRLKDKMLGWGKKAVVQNFNQDDRVLYRVQIRAGNDLDTAKRTARVLAEAGFPGFVIAR